MNKAVRFWVGIMLAFSTLIAAVILWTSRYNVSDWLILRNYQPPASIAAIAHESGMNDYGKRLFYVKNPQVSDRKTFSQQCTKQEQTIVLGCYNGLNIYIFKVEEPRLNGVEQVTAAHEMLHSAYDRLSPSERSKVDSMIDTAFKRINDSRINELADSYSKTEPGSVPNELHSILGTEVANLGPDLEAYYARYFSDRSKVVTLAVNYQQVFTGIKNEVERLDGDLALRKNEIERIETALRQQASSITLQRKTLDQLAAANNIAAYNEAVPAFNSAVDQYNAGVANLQGLIAAYNEIVAQRNNLGLEQQSLAKSLDSRLDAIEQQ